MSSTRTKPLGAWLADHLDFKTVVMFITLVGQTVFIYTKVVDRVNNIDERLAKVEREYVPSNVIETKEQALAQKFQDIKEGQRQQTNDIRELRQLLEIPVRTYIPIVRPTASR